MYFTSRKNLENYVSVNFVELFKSIFHQLINNMQIEQLLISKSNKQTTLLIAFFPDVCFKKNYFIACAFVPIYETNWINHTCCNDQFINRTNCAINDHKNMQENKLLFPKGATITKCFI